LIPTIRAALNFDTDYPSAIATTRLRQNLFFNLSDDNQSSAVTTLTTSSREVRLNLIQVQFFSLDPTLIPDAGST